MQGGERVCPSPAHASPLDSHRCHGQNMFWPRRALRSFDPPLRIRRCTRASTVEHTHTTHSGSEHASGCATALWWQYAPCGCRATTCENPLLSILLRKSTGTPRNDACALQLCWRQHVRSTKRPCSLFLVAVRGLRVAGFSSSCAKKYEEGVKKHQPLAQKAFGYVPLFVIKLARLINHKLRGSDARS